MKLEVVEEEGEEKVQRKEDVGEKVQRKREEEDVQRKDVKKEVDAEDAVNFFFV